MEELIGEQVIFRNGDIGMIINMEIGNNTDFKDIDYLLHIKVNNDVLKRYLKFGLKYNHFNFYNENLQRKLIFKFGIEKPRKVIKNNEVKISEKRHNPNKKLITSMRTIGRCYSDMIELTRGMSYGKEPRQVYENCADCFFWEKAAANQFDKYTLHYAENVARGYSVWIIPYSNLTGDSSIEWVNTLYADSIEEEYIFDGRYCANGDTRITFIRNVDHEYIFLGIYRQNSEYINEKGNSVLVYDMISDRYSFHS